MNLDQAQIKGTLYDLKDRYKWTGTKAEWDALDKSTLPQDAEVIVNITDDYDESTPGITIDTLTTLEQVNAETDVSKPVGAGAVKELNNSLVSLETCELLTQFTSTRTFDFSSYANYAFILLQGIYENQIMSTHLIPCKIPIFLGDYFLNYKDDGLTLYSKIVLQENYIKCALINKFNSVKVYGIK